MPILTLGFFCLQLDRGNIANAITDRMMEDVGINQDQFNTLGSAFAIGQSLSPATICPLALCLPSTCVLARTLLG